MAKRRKKDELGFARGDGDVGAMRSNAGNLAGAVGQGASADYQKYEQQRSNSRPTQNNNPKQKQPEKKKKGLFDSLIAKLPGAQEVKKVGGELAKSTVVGEKQFMTPIARRLPGGTADLTANEEATNRATKDSKFIKDLQKSGKIKKASAVKIQKNIAKDTSEVSKDTGSILKAMPSKKQVALGAASTAADIATAGTFSKVKGAATIGKGAKASLGLKTAKSLEPVLKETTKKRVIAGTAGYGAANATAAGLNAAAGGGSKQQIRDNAAAGLILPIGLKYGGGAVVKGASKTLEKTGLKTSKGVDELVKREKTRSLLDMARVGYEEPKVAAMQVDPSHAKEAAITEGIEKNKRAVDTIKSHMDEHYRPASDHPDEAIAHEHLTKNTEKALEDYQARTEKVFGSKNVVAGDDAKYSVPGMKADKSVPYHEPSSQFAKGYYKHLLADPETTEKSVLITAGGTGAGKTSALKKKFNEEGIDPNDYAAIVDTNLTNIKSAKSRIEPALATGRPVTVSFVYRDPLEAYHGGVIPRAQKEGRAITADTHANTHASSIDTIKQLAAEYKDHPNVSIEIIDNSRGANNSKRVMLDFLHDKSYTKNELEAKIHTLLDDHLKEGKITNEQHAIFKGKPAAESRATAAQADGVGKTGSNLQTVERPASGENVRQPKQPSETRQQTTSGRGRVEAPAKTLTPSQTAHMEPVNGYTHSEHLVTDYADMLKGIEDTAQGGQKIRNADGSYIRTSEHSRFYRDYFKEYKRAPSKAAFREEALRQLKGGTAEAGAGEDYAKLVARENQAIPTPKIDDLPPNTVGETSKSKLGTGVEQKAIQAKLVKDLGDLPEYSKVNMKEQAEHASNLLASDEQKANRIALGQEAPPAHILPESVFTAVENKALKDGNIELIRELAKSTRVGEATAMGQRIRALAERNPESPVGAIKVLAEARIKAAEKKLGKPVAKVVSQTTREIKSAVPKITRQDWDSFVESIKC
jgi:hypothetical protein